MKAEYMNTDRRTSAQFSEVLSVLHSVLTPMISTHITRDFPTAHFILRDKNQQTSQFIYLILKSYSKYRKNILQH